MLHYCSKTMTKVYLKLLFMPKEERVFQYIFGWQKTSSIVGVILADIVFSCHGEDSSIFSIKSKH